jgi:hypothetical protein
MGRDTGWMPMPLPASAFSQAAGYIAPAALEVKVFEQNRGGYYPKVIVLLSVSFAKS